MTHERAGRVSIPRGIDLTAAQAFDDADTQHAVFSRLRREVPVAWHSHADGGFWVVTRHADALRVVRDAEHFGQPEGHLIGGLQHSSPTSGAEAFAFRDGVAPFAPHAHRARARLEPAALSALAPGIRARVAERLATHAGCGAINFVELIEPLPGEIRATLVGVPTAQQDRVIDWIDTLSGRRAALPAYSDAMRRSAATELFEYAAAFLARARECPGDDLIGDWLADEAKAGGVTARQIGIFLYAFIAVGSATLQNAAAAGQRMLCDAPEAMARLRRDTTLMPGAVEEMLRLAPPFRYTRRVALRDAVIGDTPIAKGEIVTLWLESANRDAAVFEDAERFEPSRPRRPLLSFAAGGQVSLCAGLIRLELQILFEEVLNRFPELLPAGPIESAASNHENRVQRMPVHLGTPA